MRYEVTTVWRQQRTVRGRTTTRTLGREVQEWEWPDAVGQSVASFLEENRKAVFSGMEEFGTGLCVMHPLSLRCKTHGDCRAHHIESVREWVEKTTDELAEGASTDLTSGGTKWVTITIEALPDETDDEEPEPASAQGPAVLRLEP